MSKSTTSDDAEKNVTFADADRVKKRNFRSSKNTKYFDNDRDLVQQLADLIISRHVQGGAWDGTGRGRRPGKAAIRGLATTRTSRPPGSCTAARVVSSTLSSRRNFRHKGCAGVTRPLPSFGRVHQQFMKSSQLLCLPEPPPAPLKVSEKTSPPHVPAVQRPTGSAVQKGAREASGGTSPASYTGGSYGSRHARRRSVKSAVTNYDFTP